MKCTLLVEIHPWRGLRWSRDLFLVELRLGWITLAASRFLLTDKLRAWLTELSLLRARLRRPE